MGGLVAYLVWSAQRSSNLGNEPLTLYCAAGVKLPVIDVAKAYEELTGVPVEIEYDGSGRLLSTIRARAAGDLYLAADESYIKQARELGLAAESVPLARQRPCIAMRGDQRSALEIESLDDLLESDAKISLADPNVAAISRAARERLQDTNARGEPLWDQLWDRRSVTRGTVNAVANDIAGGFVDAGVIWDTTAAQYEELEIVPVDSLTANPNDIQITVLQTSEQPRRALHFMRFMAARDRGLPMFAAHRYEIVDGDRWHDHPEISLFTGGLMSPALKATVEEFERREGVSVIQSPDGCGVLVSKIKAGEHPDVYFACHPRFMEDVSELFQPAEDLTRTEMVIAVNRARASQLKITGLQDLADREGLRIGLCDSDKSALGWLARDLLQRHNLWEQVRTKVLNWPSTAERLVESVTVDALDAAIVYRANTTLRLEDIEVVSIDDPYAEAIQPIAIGNESDYPQLSRRLLDHIRSGRFTTTIRITRLSLDGQLRVTEEPLQRSIDASPWRPPPSDRRFFWCMGLLASSYVVLILAMLAADIGFAFTKRGQVWQSLLTEEVRYATWLSLISTTITTILAIWVAVPVGYLLARTHFRGKVIVDTILDIPIFLPPLVVGLSLLILFRQTPLRYLDDLFPVAFHIPAVILAQFSVATAFAARTMRGTFDTLNPRAEQVALTLGCSRWQAFTHVVLPDARRGLLTAITLAWARSLGEFGPILVFAGTTRKRTEVLPVTVHMELSIGNIEGAVGVSLLMVVIAMSVLIVFRLLGGNERVW